MRRRAIHSLAVDLSRKGRMSCGIITTSDIRDKIVGDERDPAAMPVSHLMTAPIVCARPEWTRRQSARKMKELGIHHSQSRTSPARSCG